MSYIKPEKKIEILIRAWCFQNDIWVDVYDSKGSFSRAANRFVKNTGLKTGTPDLVGMNKMGIKIAIELKSPGKERVARLEQLQFLHRVISYNAFGCVVSSSDQLSEIYNTWLKLSQSERQKYLFEKLPKKALINGKTIDWIP